MSVTTQVFSGTWEEVSEKHKDDLAGHRVEVRIVDTDAARERAEQFLEAIERIRKLAPDVRPLNKVFTAEDIYSDHL